MSNGFASALEIFARYIRDNDAITARRLITERIQTVEQSEDEDGRENGYLLNMREGFRAVLAGMYAVAKRAER
jgi:hypothetical protein